MKSHTLRGSVFAVAAAIPLICFAAAPAQAQEPGQITGTVVSASTARPITGAQVFIDGTGIGGLTNTEGTYLLLNVPEGPHVVRVQVIGYGSTEQEVTVVPAQTVTANFELTNSAVALDEIVINGAGQAVERRRLGNTIGTINVAQELGTAPVSSPSEVLQAREPGIIVTQTDGMAGGASRIRIRGSASLSESNEPVIYLDGVRIDSEVGAHGAGAASRLDDINPSSIASISVLKGAAAATLYGTEASNGVIQIFTRRGESGEAQWTLDMGGGFSTNYDRIPPISGFALAAEPTTGVDRGTIGIREYWGIDVEPYEVFSVPVTPFILETGNHRNSSISVSGGSNLLSYYVNGRYAYENGILGGTDYGPAKDTDTQRQVNANLTIFPSENLRLRLTTRYTNREHTLPASGDDIEGLFGESVSAQPETAWEGNVLGHASFITLPESMQILRSEEVHRFGGSFSANYTPLRDFTLEATAGLDVTDQVGIDFRRFGWNVNGRSGRDPRGAREVENRNNLDLTFDVRGDWSIPVGDEFTSALVVGAQMLVGNDHRTTAETTDFPAPGLEVVGAGSHPDVNEFILETVQAGIFAQETIGFRDYLFATVGTRVDRHSAFGESAGAALYPKVGLSFVPSDMPGWSNIGPLSTLQLRGAIGRSGTQPGAFDKFTTFGSISAETGPGVEPDNLGNADLEPEVSTELEAGFEAGLYNDQIRLQATYWNRSVSDVLVSRQFPPSGGFTDMQLVNLGAMTAWGVELGVNGMAYSGPKLSVSLFATGAYLVQEVTDLGGAPPIGGGGFIRNGIKEGYTPGAFFGSKLMDAPYPFDTNGDGQPDTREVALAYFASPRGPWDIPLVVVDEDGDGDILDHYLGKPVPDWSGAFGADITFLSNFVVSSMFEYRAGNYQVENLMGAWRNSHDVSGHNTPRSAQIQSTLLNPASTPEERLAAAQGWAHTGASLAPYPAMNYIEDADFIRWRELSLTYRVSAGLASRIGASAFSLTAGARNLMLWTKYSGMSPESNVSTHQSRGGFTWGVEAWVPPAPRRFTFSARVSF